MENSLLDTNTWTATEATPQQGASPELPAFTKAIIYGAVEAAEMRKKKTLLSEDDTIKLAVVRQEKTDVGTDVEPIAQIESSRNLLISLRAAFSGLMVSFVDSAPSEIAVATFKNMNAIATWDMLRATYSTVYITVTSVQVDNMVPNARFPVAVCPFDQPRNSGNDAIGTPVESPPLLVIGLSFAPRHKSGIVVRNHRHRLSLGTVRKRSLLITNHRPFANSA
jgi:hypothetical protein